MIGEAGNLQPRASFVQHPSLALPSSSRMNDPALCRAVMENNLDEVMRLYDERNVSLESTIICTEKYYGFEMTALMLASRNGYESIVNFLVTNGALVDQENDEEKTALHLAAERGHPTVLRLLIEGGANINARNYRGQTALYMAAFSRRSSCSSCVRLLLREGADDRITNGDYGQYPLHTPFQVANLKKGVPYDAWERMKVIWCGSKCITVLLSAMAALAATPATPADDLPTLAAFVHAVPPCMLETVFSFLCPQ